KPFSGQIAVITGGAGGLGFALARHLARAGASVAILDVDARRTKARAASLRGALGLTTDVTDEPSCARAVDAILARWKRIDILVNAVGITGRTGVKSHEVDPEDFDRVMAVNVRSCFITSRCLLPVMLRQKYGRILHVASIAGKEGNAGMVAYS